MGGVKTTINKVKYIGIASLTIAILSVLTLNIISSYSSSNTLSNAEEVGSNSNSDSELSAQANDSSVCDNTNTNAAACISMSISSHSATGDTNDGNLSLSIPQGGGLVAGRHTVKVVTNSVGGASLDLYTTDSANLTSVDNQDSIISSVTNGNNYYDTTWPLQNSTWGVAMPSSNYANQMGRYNNADVYEQYVTNPGPIKDTGTYAGISPKLAGIIKVDQDSQDNQIDTMIEQWSKAGAYMQNIYYGAMLDNPASFPAGDYSTSVVYAATVKLPSKPTITSIDPNQYELGSDTNLDSNNRLPITITGTNLKSTYKVYLESNADSSKRYGITTENIASITDTELKLTLPTDITNSDLEAGDYTIHVVTQGGEASIGFTYTEKKALSVYDSVDNVRVDWDANMIPVYHTGDTTNAEWTSLTQDEINDSTVTWFNYTGKRWANAVTVKEEALGKYQNKHEVVDEEDVLGYWVYIPRYAYKVMRYSVNDQYVSDSKAISDGGFEIVFETKDTPKKTPAACSNSNSNQYYQDCSNVSQEYGAETGTAWATHPAFSWLDSNGDGLELNGFWIGKFETTGSSSSPTVLPNQYHLYIGTIGDYYDISQSIGIEDKNNTYGNSAQTSYNGGKGYHNLAISTSHMLKNSEWGAVAYLASSKYGAGINNVQLNNRYSSGGTGNGPNGGKYNTANGQLASTTNNVYGVYDMAGGAYEYVMGSYTTNASQSSTSQFSYAVKPPYVDLYVNPPFSGNYTSNNNLCTWATCGGHALYETKNVQSVSSNIQSWCGDISNFVSSSNPWFRRGGSALDGSGAGVFASHNYDGNSDLTGGFRVALLL